MAWSTTVGASASASVRWRCARWVLHVNGERLFVKGANLLPVQRLPGTASPSEVANDVRSARRAGLDMIRPLARIARPELYRAADDLGMLVWQDLPIRGVMSRSVAAEARRQAREAVDLLGHHPSVAVWCAHDEPFPRARRSSATPPAWSRLGPSWNRDVLDRRLARVLSRCDGSRPVVAHTGVPPHFPSLAGTTSHLWFGLHGGRAADLAPTLARVPAMGQFVTAFGTPVAADQPDVVKTTIEILRRLKYRPTGGFMLHALADVGAGPGVGGPNDGFGCVTSREEADTEHRSNSGRGPASGPRVGGPGPASGPRNGFGVLDGLRRPKPGWQALVDSCRPLLVVADPLPASVRAGDRLSLAVHVVNDSRQDVDGMQVRARVIGPDGAVCSDQRWKGSAPADECVAVGRIDTLVPSGGPGKPHPGVDARARWPAGRRHTASPNGRQPLHDHGRLATLKARMSPVSAAPRSPTPAASAAPPTTPEQSRANEGRGVGGDQSGCADYEVEVEAGHHAPPDNAEAGASRRIPLR